MDVSPLPHKVPFVMATQVEPTPQISPMEEATPLSTESMQDISMDSTKQSAPHE